MISADLMDAERCESRCMLEMRVGRGGREGGARVLLFIRDVEEVLCGLCQVTSTMIGALLT